ncbi:hypothetical protein JTB14_037983 [Gonioctena quinquepunctata]|nr:hypothetical protein JTB14_037983 [Gonioctena quinquepunctata]
MLGALNHKCREEMSKLRTREMNLLKSAAATILLPGSASYSHFRNSRRFNYFDLNEVTNVANKALEIAFATKALKDRSPSTNPDDFVSALDIFLSDHGKSKFNILIGDININSTDENESTPDTYLDTLNSHGYASYINANTRVSEFNQTCLDHIFLKIDNSVDAKDCT